MKRILAGLIISLFATAPVLAQGVQAVPGEYIVKYKSTSTSVNVSKVRSKLASKANLRKAFPAMGMYHISLKAQAGEAANLEEIKNDPDVEYVEPNLIWNKTQDNSSSNNAQSSAYQGVYSYNDIINNHMLILTTTIGSLRRRPLFLRHGPTNLTSQQREPLL